MTEYDEPPNRAYYQAHPDDIRVRELDEDTEEGVFEVRMPIASTGEVRNEGDDPLTRDELDGMARQINDQDVGVFLAHGQSTAISGGRYDQVERLGNWQDADVVSTSDRADRADESNLLEASAVLMDPDTLPNIGPIRDALGTIKEQAKRGIGISASIGWREDDAAPGGNDLMEASIVGIPADPRTVTQGATAEAVARAAVDAGADPERLVEAVRAAVMGPDETTDERMSDDDTEPDAENEASDTDDADEPTEDERQETPEWAADLRELLENMNETLGDIAEAVRQEDEDEDDDMDDEDDDEEENAADEPDAEQSGEDADTEEDAERDGDDEIDALREHLDALREGGIDVTDVDLPEPDDEQEADDAEGEAAAPVEDDFKKRLR